MKNQIHYNMSFPDYQAIDALNSGKVRAALKSLRYMRRQEMTPEPDYNYTFEFGKAFAYACEDIQIFHAHCAVGPTKTPTAKAWKEQLEEEPHIVLLTESDYNLVKVMHAAISQDENLKHILDGEKELTFTWEDEVTGCAMKGRCDLLVPIGPEVYHLIDVKTIADIQKFGWQVRDFKYDVQLAMYADGLRHCGKNILQVSNLFIEKEQVLPEMYMHTYNDEQLSNAWDRYQMSVKSIKDARSTGVYSGYTPPINKDSLTGF